MAAEVQHAPDPVTDLLQPEPWAWNFLEAVRHIECRSADHPRIGTSRHPAEDPVRFGQEPSLAFPPTSIAAVRSGDDETTPRLLVHFLGLLGCNGPMPLHFTEYVFQRLHHAGDGTLAAFLDMFHHRMISFFYRAWALPRQTVSFDRGDDPFGGYVASLVGLGQDTLRDRDAVPDVAKLHYSGHLASATKHASGLRALLQGDLGIATEIEQFIGQWLPLPEVSLCALGRSSETGCIGDNLVVGSTVWDCVQRFRIRLGPMPLQDYLRFLPGVSGLQRLNAWVRNYASLELEWEVQLILRAEDVKPIVLGKGDNARLGQTTWLRVTPPKRDPDDLVMGPFGAGLVSGA